jgi:hypothetical protein
MKGKNVWPCAINFVPYPPHFCVTLFEWGVFHVQRTLEGSSRTHVDITCNKAPVVMITKPSDPIRVGTCEPRSTAAQLYNWPRLSKGENVQFHTHQVDCTRVSRRVQENWWTLSEMCEAFFWIEKPPHCRDSCWIFHGFFSISLEKKWKCPGRWVPYTPSSHPYVYTAVRLSVCSVLEGREKK